MTTAEEYLGQSVKAKAPFGYLFIRTDRPETPKSRIDSCEFHAHFGEMADVRSFFQVIEIDRRLKRYGMLFFENDCVQFHSPHALKLTVAATVRYVDQCSCTIRWSSGRDATGHDDIVALMIARMAHPIIYEFLIVDKQPREPQTNERNPRWYVAFTPKIVRWLELESGLHFEETAKKLADFSL